MNIQHRSAVRIDNEIVIVEGKRDAILAQLATAKISLDQSIQHIDPTKPETIQAHAALQGNVTALDAAAMALNNKIRELKAFRDDPSRKAARTAYLEQLIELEERAVPIFASYNQARAAFDEAVRTKFQDCRAAYEQLYELRHEFLHLVPSENDGTLQDLAEVGKNAPILRTNFAKMGEMWWDDGQGWNELAPADILELQKLVQEAIEPRATLGVILRERGNG